MAAQHVAALLASPEPVVLDGGLATELERRGHDLSDDLWSARLLRDDPGAIEDVHLTYFRAGAQVATTASYQASFEGSAAAGIEREEAAQLIRRSVELADRARRARVVELEAAGEPAPALLVAASVGPYWTSSPASWRGSRSAAGTARTRARGSRSRRPSRSPAALRR